MVGLHVVYHEIVGATVAKDTADCIYLLEGMRRFHAVDYSRFVFAYDKI